MKYGRYAHSSCSLIQEKEERVIVAGGWSGQGRAQASVEIYSFSKEQWIEFTSLPSPRVYFSLQVTKKCFKLFDIVFLQVTDVEVRVIGGYYKENNKNVFPGLATLKIGEEGLDRVWREEKKEVDPYRQRAGFMTAEVPWPWIHCI